MNSLFLKSNHFLQDGKYRIIRHLSRGGFGITYEAEQVLLHRRVAIKEFFMKDFCERDGDTCCITVGTGNQRALVEKFRGKFIKEAQMIAGMDHPHIVRVLDVFEENGTAYYVMDYLPGGSLADKVKKEGPLTEAKAEEYIRQVANALAYIHSQNTVHLDVKPSNILLNLKGEAVLIDFGISKHYDDSGDQTSSTPVGISKGYAPIEQSRDGDLSQFKPSTDIYSLGATLFFLLTGQAPLESSILYEDSLTKPDGISTRLWNVIETAMQPRRKDRPQSIRDFLRLFDYDADTVSLSDCEETLVKNEDETRSTGSYCLEKSRKKYYWWLFILVGLILAIIYIINNQRADIADGNFDANLQSANTLSTLPEEPIFDITTSMGNIKVRLFKGTPRHRDNFEKLALAGFYDSLLFHRVIKDFVIQCGDPNTRDTSLVAQWGEGGPGYEIPAEFVPEYRHKKGALAAARRGDMVNSLKESSGSQFYIVQNSNNCDHLNGEYTVFGETITGFDVIDKIAGVITNSKDVPISPVRIMSIRPAQGTLNGHDWVDLGLSSGLKWATCNVGASSPEEYGDYFAWGGSL